MAQFKIFRVDFRVSDDNDDDSDDDRPVIFKAGFSVDGDDGPGHHPKARS